MYTHIVTYYQCSVIKHSPHKTNSASHCPECPLQQHILQLQATFIRDQEVESSGDVIDHKIESAGHVFVIGSVIPVCKENLMMQEYPEISQQLRARSHLLWY
jgi:hypothetical protein